jgi:hypothetical protein
MPRDGRGRFVAGKPLDEELRRQISEGQIRRHRRAREQCPPIRRGTKPCSKCGERKIYDLDNTEQSEFSIRKRKLKTGDTLYPAGECRECSNARAAAHREKLRAEGTLSEKQKEWNSHRDREHRKRYQREYQAQLRRQQGIPVRGPWKRYRDNSHELVDRRPFMEWLEEWQTITGVADRELGRRVQFVDETAEVDAVAGRIQQLRKGQGTVTIEFVDLVLVAAGMSGHLSQLYPLNAAA